MKNILRPACVLFLMTVILLFNFLPSQAEAGNGDFAGGDGSADDPFQVATAEQLDNVRGYLNAHFIQVADIDLRDFLNPGEEVSIDGPGWEPIGTESNPFSGKFDGDGYTIYSLFINRDASYIGLFGYTNSNSVITGVKLQLFPGEVYDITGNNFVGSLVGHNEGLISQCSAEMRVRGKNYVGGLVGYNEGNYELDCLIEKSFFLGRVTGEKRVGGLVGGNYHGASIENCYVRNRYLLAAEDYFGGLVGRNIDARIYKTFAFCGFEQLGDHFPENDGGLVGYNNRTTELFGVHQSYYNRQAAERDDTGKGEPRTTTEMTYPYEPEDDVYEDWDFNTVWVEDKDNKNGGYPYLKWIGYDFDGGDGNAGNPFQVATAEQLDRVRDYLDAHFIQTANIDLNRSPYNEGEGWEPIGSEIDPFTGSYDGDGYTIDDLYINRGNDNQIGLFGVISDYAMISNVHLEDVDVTGNSRVGSLAGDNSDGTITSCSVFLGSVKGDGGVGGLVGRNDHIIKGSYTRVSVESDNSQAGGLVGVNWDNGAITEYSYATGSVKGINSVGGLVGSNRGIIDFCHADGPVEGAGHSVGGLVGSTSNNSSIMNSHSTGNVEGEERVGGLVGRHLTIEDDDRYIGNCYATGDVTGTEEVGGLVGRNDRKIVNSYATGEVVGSAVVGGLTGLNINRGFISDSWAEGDVSGNSKVGGLVGQIYYSTNIDVSIEKSFALGNVTGDGPEQEEIGGLVGYNQGTIEESWAEGVVSGNSQVGGLVGFSHSSAGDRVAFIKNSYATGGARGNSDIGGLIGLIDNARVKNTYATGLVSGKEEVGGLVGQNNYVGRGDENVISSYYDRNTTGQEDTGKGIPKTTKEMLSGIPSPEIYTEWPTNIWNFTEGDYPKFITSPTNADLLALFVTPGVLTPPFNAAIIDYTLDVTQDVDSVSVTATLSKVNWNASITIDGSPASSGFPRTVNLEPAGTITEIEIVVTAADMETRKIYTVSVRRTGVLQKSLYASFADAVYAFDGNVWLDTPVAHAPALALAAHGEKLYGAFGDGIYVYDGTSWDVNRITPGVASNMASYDGQLYGCFSDATYVYDGNQWTLFTWPTVALASYQGHLYASFSDAVYAFDGSDWIETPVAHAPALALAVHDGKLYGAFQDGIYVYDGTSWDINKITPGVASNMASYDGKLYGSFADATYVYDGTSWPLFTWPTNALAAY